MKIFFIDNMKWFLGQSKNVGFPKLLIEKASLYTNESNFDKVYEIYKEL